MNRTVCSRRVAQIDPNACVAPGADWALGGLYMATFAWVPEGRSFLPVQIHELIARSRNTPRVECRVRRPARANVVRIQGWARLD